MYIYASEMFPSNLRGFAVGISNILANIAASLVPYFGLIADKLRVHFLALFIPISFLVLIGSFPMPETMNKKLQN